MHPPLDLQRVRVWPLATRKSLTRVEDILITPDQPAPAVAPAVQRSIDAAAASIRAARARGAGVILMYGAHLLRNGAALILERLMRDGWLTHLATNGAGTIHDWEYAWLGRSTESVEDNVATGTFGTWDETGRYLHLALLVGGLRGEGYGRSLGRFIHENGTALPSLTELTAALRADPADPLAPAWAELIQAMHVHGLSAGRIAVEHHWPQASILAQAFRLGVPLTVHPGIGYDIVSCHPMFNGAAIGRAAGWDYASFAGAVDTLDGGVVLSVGSAIMAPQVFEKSLSCANNLRRQDGRPVVADHVIHVVDLQDGGNWDWTQGEPPKSNPAYYLRFCKSFSRMGGTMHYTQADNLAFIHGLAHALRGTG